MLIFSVITSRAIVRCCQIKYQPLLWKTVRYKSIRMPGIKKRVDNIVKSAEDNRLYRGLLLENDMKVLVISDSGTDKSAASIDVNVGHMSDPDNLPGLAHFCEHMLFLGTEKYPSENEYNKFLSEHGGNCNASTTSDHTTYYFDVVPEHLFGAMDRFAQFFLAPLFMESATDREVNAVHSEHEKNLSNDSWRLDQLEKSTSKEDHDFNKFGTGSKETLDIIPKAKGINVREELLKFHEKWYSSNIMTLAVLGKESLDELEKMVVDLFSNVKNKNVKSPSWTEHPLGPEQLKMKGYVVPVKDFRNLTISFPIPDLHEHYKSGPGNYLSHLFGHEGPGSLLSALRAQGWCNSLVGGTRTAARGFGFFGINVDLTEEGIDHVDDIVNMVFQYVKLLKKEGPKEWIYEEYRDNLTMHFRFKDKESPSSYVSSLVHSLQDYPLEEVLSGGYLISSWRPDLIDMVLNLITPENIRVAVVAKKFESIADQEEKWYGTKYKLEKIPDETIEAWKQTDLNDKLKLPPKNEFIPTSFDILPRDENDSPFPTIIQDTPLSRVWFKQDDEFLLPKANISFEFASPLAYLDPLHSNMMHMFVRLFKDALNEYAYAAELAGLRWELSNTKYGMLLGVFGYNNKQHVLLEKIIEKMTNFEIDPKRFAILKENYIRSLKNFEAEQPYQHAVYYLAVLLVEQAWTKVELLAATDELTVERVSAFIPQILSNMHIECFIHGNVNKGVENSLHLSSCTEVYYQCTLQSTETNMLLELLVQIINEPCFNILRTKEQLGYIVFSGLRRSNGAQGLRVIVQSVRHPNYVDQRVEAFLEAMGDLLEEMCEEEFERHKEALAAQRLEKPKKLVTLTSRYWAEISSQQYNFNRPEIEVAYLRTLTKDDIIKFYKEYISYEAPHRHKIAVHVLSTAEGGAGKDPAAANYKDPSDGLKPPPPCKPPSLITDITNFKSSQAMFPLVQPYINVRPKGAKSKL